MGGFSELLPRYRFAIDSMPYVRCANLLKRFAVFYGKTAAYRLRFVPSLRAKRAIIAIGR